MDEPTPPSGKGDGPVEGPPPPDRAVEEVAESLFASVGAWGITTRRSRGSQRRRIALSIASLVAGILLIGLFAQGGSLTSPPETVFTVLVILLLLIVGVAYGLRPWSKS